MKFQIKALSDSGGVVSLALDAADEADADRQARARGCNVLSLRRSNSWNFERFTRGYRFPLALFNQEVLALLGAGLTLVESIEALAEKEAQSSTRTTLDRLIEQLRHGRTLSQAMQEQPHAFPMLYVSTVRATERTGDLTDALQRYVAYESQLEVVRKKVISASIYPVLLIAAGTLVLFFLLGYVIPRFSMVYDEVKGNLPLVSRLLLDLGTFLAAHGPLVALAAIAVISLLGRILFTAAARRWIGAKLWRLPAIGTRMRLY